MATDVHDQHGDCDGDDKHGDGGMLQAGCLQKLMIFRPPRSQGFLQQLLNFAPGKVSAVSQSRNRLCLGETVA